MRPVWAEIDRSAIRHNVAVLRDLVAPAALCVVVKADGYGHGALEVGRVALEAGAERLAVALVEEGVDLRRGGVTAPILVLSEPVPEAFAVLVGNDLTPVLYTMTGVDATSAASAQLGVSPYGVHLKVNTGMNRVGADAAMALEVARAIDASPDLHIAGVMTHLAAADDTESTFTATQLERFDAVVDALAAEGISAGVLHAANSGGSMCHPPARRDLVRCGIAVYGICPAPGVGVQLGLRPALRLRAAVSYLRVVPPGEGISYGLRHRVDEPAIVATVPIGYADGVPRRLSSVGHVLVGGRRCPIIGAVTMDQLMVDLGPPGGPGEAVGLGDEVVLLGSQGQEEIAAEEWAGALGTIAYEVVCGISARVPRRYVDSES